MFVKETWSRLWWMVAVSIALLAWIYLQFPLLWHNFSSSIPGGLSTIHKDLTYFFGGDHIQVFYLGWKLKQAVMTAGQSIFVDNYNFASQSQLFYDAHLGVQFLMIAGMGALFGDIAGYNIGFIVLPIVMTGVFGYLMLRQATRSSWIATLGALAMAILPYRIAQMMGGHSSGAIFTLVPLFWWLMLRHRFSAKGDYPAAAGAGLILLLTAMSDEHLGFYQLLLSGFVCFVWGLQDAYARRSLFDAAVAQCKKWWPLLAGFGAVMGYGLLYNALFGQANSSAATTEKIKRLITDISQYSHNINAYFSRGENNITVILFYSMILLTAVLVITRRRNLSLLLKSPWLPFALALPIFMALMLGPGPHWSQRTGIYDFFYNHVPFFCYQRIAGKMMPEVVAMIVLLAASTWQAVRDEQQATMAKKTKMLYTVAVILGCCAFVAQVATFVWIYPSNKLSVLLEKMDHKDVDPAPMIESNTDDRSIIVFVPATLEMVREQTFSQYLAFRTKRRFASGYHGQPPHYFDEMVNSLASEPFDQIKSTTVHLFQKNGYSHVLLDETASRLTFPKGLLGKFEKLPFLKKTACVKQYCLFAILPDQLARVESNGFDGFIYDIKAGRPGRWMHREWPISLARHMGYDEQQFAIYSLIDANREAGGQGPWEASMLFDTGGKEFPFWILQQGEPPIEVRPPWAEKEDGYFRVKFTVTGPQFLLATKETFVAPNQTKLGHFIRSIRFTPR